MMSHNWSHHTAVQEVERVPSWHICINCNIFIIYSKISEEYIFNILLNLLQKDFKPEAAKRFSISISPYPLVGAELSLVLSGW